METSAPVAAEVSDTVQETTPGTSAADIGKTSGSEAGPAEGKVAAPKPAEKFTVKVDGTLKQLTLDELIRHAQKGIGSEKRFGQAAELTKKNQALLKALTESDDDQFEQVLKQLGRDPDAWAEKRLAKLAQMQNMTPEQRELAELKAQLAERDRESQTKDEQLRAEKQAQLEQQIWSKMETDALATLEKVDLGGMPKAEALYLLADIAEANLNYGLDLTPDELAAEVTAKIAKDREFRSMKLLSGLEGDALLKELTEPVVNAVLKAAVARFKGGQSLSVTPKPPAPKTDEPKLRHISENDLKDIWF